MGNHQSNEVSPDVLKSLKTLGKQLQNCDDESKALGNLVRNFTRAPSTLLEAQPKLLKVLEPIRQRQASDEDIEKFLTTIKHNQNPLSSDQVKQVAPKLRKWRLDDESTTSRLSDASRWIEDPSYFWGAARDARPATSAEVVQKCLQYEKDYLQNDTTLLKLRRRVMREIICLFTTCEKIRTEGNKGGVKLVTDEIATKKKIDDADKKQRQLLHSEVRKRTVAGRRWLRLGRGVSLGVHQNATSFERSPLSEVEIDAARQYCGQLPVFANNTLSTAWFAIVKWFVQDLYETAVRDEVFLYVEKDNSYDKQPNIRKNIKKKDPAAGTTTASNTPEPIDDTDPNTCEQSDDTTSNISEQSDDTASETSEQCDDTAFSTPEQSIDVYEIYHTPSTGHDYHQPKRRRLDGVAPVAIDEQIPDTHSGLRLIQPHSDNSTDLNNFEKNTISETRSAQHPSNTHHECSPSGVNSNESNKTPDVHMDGVTMEVIEDHRPHAGKGDEIWPAAQDLVTNEFCPGNDVPRMPMDFASEQGSLDIHLDQNGNTASSNIPPDQFTSNMTEVSVDNTTLPERPNGLPCRVGEEAPRNKNPPSTEVVESSNIHSREAEAREQIAGTSWTSSNKTTTNGCEDSDSESGEEPHKRRRVGSVSTDTTAEGDRVNLGMSLAHAQKPSEDYADKFTTDEVAADNFTPQMEIHPRSDVVEVVDALRTLAALAPIPLTDCEERSLGDHVGEQDELGPTAQALMSADRRSSAEGEEVDLGIFPDALILGDGAPYQSTDFGRWLDYLEKNNVEDVHLDNEEFCVPESEHDIQDLDIDNWLNLGDGFPNPHW
ncbi:hypothetical protein PV08_11841 [Exophiala spinifera]|uniref:Uncharacterized protein n=1 Tax=Exophiala spinifera TaxID=91928 RepID=A0A0D2AUC5_9EURO|nr:uncharacterized protein PV08_11841 [Exophiala spinifera]KIW10065.1 hypothetical protein PV08_11841 [Exophiala spinifera]